MPIVIPTVKNRHTQSAALDWSEVVNCANCNVAWKASVDVVGRGAAESSLWASRQARETASLNAGVDAFHDAKDTAQAMISRAHCGACGKRLGGWNATFVIIVKSMFVGAILGAMPAAAIAKPKLAVASFCLVFVLISVIAPIVKLNQADERVYLERLS